jgi:hypothetical protein
MVLILRAQQVYDSNLDYVHVPTDITIQTLCAREAQERKGAVSFKERRLGHRPAEGLEVEPTFRSGRHIGAVFIESKWMEVKRRP